MASRSRYFRLLAAISVIFALTAAVGTLAQPSDEAIWKNFMEWLNKAPPVDGPRFCSTSITSI